MTEQLDPSTVEQILARAGIALDAVSTSPLVLIAADRPSIVWANAPAVALLGVAHEREASRRLFRSGSSSQALVDRLRRMASGPEPRLDRLMISRGFQVIPQIVVCRAVEGLAAEALILVQFLTSASDDKAAGAPFQSALKAEPGETRSGVVAASLVPGPASAADVAARLKQRFSGRRILRVVWEADRDGIVTQIDGDFAEAVGASALAIGDAVAARLGALDSAAGNALTAAFAERRTVTGLRFRWPVAGARAAVPAVIGCVFRSGDAAGARGFCEIHMDQVEETSPAQAPEQTLGHEIEPDGPVDDGADPPLVAAHDTSAALAMPDAAAPDAELPPKPSAQDLIQANENLPSAPEVSAEPAGGTGNVVHFPTLKPSPVHGGSANETKPAASPRPTSAPVEEEVSQLAPPQWSESPAGSPIPDGPAQLTTDEQDAFEHIRKVLGTRPVSSASVEGERRDVQIPPRSEAEQAFHAILPILDALPVGTMLHRNRDLIHVNAALFSALGATSMAEIQVDIDHSTTPDAVGEVSPFVLTSPAGKVLTGEARTILLGGVPATLVTFPSNPDPRLENEIAALRAERQHLAALADESKAALAMSADGVSIVDESGTIGWASTGAEHLFGYRGGELVGKAGSSLLMADQDPSWRMLLTAATEEGSSPAVAGGLLGRTREGGLVPLQVRVGQVAPGKFCVSWTDESSRKRAENGLEAARREAERANRLKSEFLAKVSHEIRTPLNAILGFAEVITDERLGPIGNTRYAEYLKDIHASGTHVMSLVNDLLDLSRIEAGRLELKLEAIDANAVVGACVNTLQTQAHRERVIVRLSLAPGLPPALADERSLRQIVLNLLSNAIKFNEPGGQVIVSTAVTDAETIAIRIRDTGLGMSDDDIETAMEPFRQLPSGKSAGGSGLGLPLTKALVEASCASMTIKSRPGEGTLVEVLFPVVEHEPLSVLAQ